MNEGGVPLKRYQIEMKDVGHPAGWVPLSAVPADTTDYLVSGLQPGFAYRFRVRAVNDEGAGDWLESDKSVAFCRPTTNPSEPEAPLRLIPDGKNAVRLTWRAPLDDGGVPIKDYVVEACLDQAGDRWKPVDTVTTMNKRVEGLLEDSAYRFRVSARNEADKVGPPLYSDLYKPSAPLTPPGPPIGPLTGRGVNVGQIELHWNPPTVGGSEGYGVPEEYLIERYDQTRLRWVYVTRQSAQIGTNAMVSSCVDYQNTHLVDIA